MKKAGEILKAERLKKGFKLSWVAEKTKIREKFLRAIEEGEYEKLGGAAYVFGFVGNYSRYLGLDEKQMEAFLRREIDEGGQSVLPEDLGKENKRFLAGKLPTILLVFIFSLIISGVGFYLFVQSRQFLLTPKIEVYSPEENFSTFDSYVMISGKVDYESEVFINDQKITVLDDGEFKQRINLAYGVNKIEIRVKNKLGKEGRVKKEVWRIKD